MKLDLNHIDDIFKEGLEDFTQQPSQGLWKKISGKLLWSDLLHFRLVNIPKAWFGALAGLMAVAVFLVLWFPEDQQQAIPLKLETQNEHQNIETAGDFSESPYAEIGTNEIVPPAEGQMTDDIKVAGDHPTEIVDAETETAGQNIQKNESGIVSAAELRQSRHIAQANDEIVNPSLPEISNNAKSASSASEKSSSTAIKAAENISITAGIAEINEAHADSKNQGAENDGTLNPANTANLSMTAINAPAHPVHENVTESPEFPSALLPNNAAIHAGTFGSESTQAKPVILKPISPKSFSFGPIINSKYKAPRRQFQEGLTLGYRANKPYFSIAAYFAPEITEYYRPASESREQSYAGGFSVSYVGRAYLIQAGIEFSSSDDLGDYMVNLNSYDSIGYYNGISGFEIIPGDAGEDSLLYHYHTVEVWDTLQHHSHQQTKNKYTYLQIPLMVGYKAMESGRFSASIKAGPNFSFLLNGAEQSLSFQPSQTARVTGIENYTAPRLQTSVQVLVSLAMQFQFTERFGLLVEPTYRYYFNSVYDVNGDALKNPYGIGVRGGLFYNF